MSTELAWAAGFFDGEGSTTYQTSTKSLCITVGQKHPEVLQRFASAVGIRPVYETHRIPYPWYTVAASGVKAVDALQQLWPYLSSEKKKQAHEKLQHVRELREELKRRVVKVEEAYDRLEKLPL